MGQTKKNFDGMIEVQRCFRKNALKNSDKELAILVLKPDFKEEYEMLINSFVKTKSLKIIHQFEFLFDKKSILILYHDIFRYSPSDITFGLTWKQDKMSYMSSGQSKIFLVQGNNAQRQSELLKYEIRQKYNKLSIPDKPLDRATFLEMAIKNIIHVVDGDDIEPMLWLLSCIDN